MVIRSSNYRIWNEDEKRWEYPTLRKPNINGKLICERCKKPRIDINGVEDCDFCLQSLTQCDLVDYACCGHGNDDNAYISFKDGRRWILDQDNSYSPKEQKSLYEFRSNESNRKYNSYMEWLEGYSIWDSCFKKIE